MADKRDLSEIRPAKGVKIKKIKKEEQKGTDKPYILKNVDPGVPLDQLPPPTEESAKIRSQINDAKIDLLESMKEFNSLLNVKVLLQNKSQKDRDYEKAVISKMIKAAENLERYTPSEGALAVCIFAVRQALILRDAGNELAYELENVKKDLEQIKRDIYEYEETTDKKV